MVALVALLARRTEVAAAAADDMPCFSLPEGVCKIGPLQADVDSFASRLSSRRLPWVGLVEITGDVEDLRPLSQSGWSGYFAALRVWKTTRLTSLDGLGSFKIAGHWPDGTSLLISYNSALQSLEGCASGNLSGSVSIHANSKLVSLHGLEGIESVSLAFDDRESISIFDNDALQSVEGLAGLRGSLPGSLIIYENDELVSLHGLEGIESIGKDSGNGLSIFIFDNGALQSLQGLAGVRGRLPGCLSLCGNSKLVSLHGLEGIESIGECDSGSSITISGNLELQSLGGLAGLRGSLPSGLTVHGNGKLVSLHGLEGIESIGKDADKGESISISGNGALQSVEGLAGLRGSLPGSLNIQNNFQLASLQGLEGVESIGQDRTDRYSVFISSNDALQSVKGLAGVRGSLPGSLIIQNNGKLVSLHGLEGIEAIGFDRYGSSIRISGNGELQSVEGLASVRGPLHGSLIIQNNGKLVSFHGLEGIEAVRIDHASSLTGGNSKLHLQDLMCPGGEFARKNGWKCERCGDMQVSSEPRIIPSDGAIEFVCRSCKWWQEPSEGMDDCKLSPWPMTESVLGFFCLLIGCVLLSGNLQLTRSFGSRWQLVGRSIPISSISSEVVGRRTRIVLTTCGRHGLRQRCRRSFPIMFADTGNIFLDTSSPRLPPREELLCLRARVLGEDRLEVLDANGDALDGDFPAAMGWSALPATRCLMHSGTGLPVLVSGPLAICVALASLGIMVTQPEHPERCTPAECLAGVAMALSVIATSLRRWCEPRTPLRRRLDEYQEKLREANPDPRPCERGAARAIRLEQLLDLCTSFQDFVQKRSMYILEPSIIRPLTVQHKLSYAEVAGPSCVEWFVSHYWGHPFVETCAALEKHARRVTDCPRLWYDAAYWVCTFSNNQYVVQEELGNGQWDRSSFYLALRSDGCRGTCMVLDEDLFPLERSWCLFELLQTMIRVEEHTQEMQNGFGGILFCTSSGIINRGEANSEVSLNMGNKLVTLRLEDAKASSLADKQMIDSLVVSEMGSFDEINGKLRAQFASALAASEASMLDKFALIRSELGAAQTGSRSLAEDSE